MPGKSGCLVHTNWTTATNLIIIWHGKKSSAKTHISHKNKPCVCAHHALIEKVLAYVKRLYSGTSDKGPSEIGTTSLQRTLVAAPC